MKINFRKILIFFLLCFLSCPVNFLVGRVQAQEIPPTVPPLPEKEGKPPVEARPTLPPQPTSSPSLPEVKLISEEKVVSPTKTPEPTSSVLNEVVTPSLENITSTPVPSSFTPSPASFDSQESNLTQKTDINDPFNQATGFNSLNSATESLEKKLEVLNNNLANLQNEIAAITQTGFNSANLNTLNGSVISGDAFSTLNLLNKVNSTLTGIGNFAVFDIYGSYLGDIVFSFAEESLSNSFSSPSSVLTENSFTGPFSENQALSQSNFLLKEINGNEGVLKNEISLQAVSGGNSASYNTGDGVIKTGKAGALANIVNLVNTNLNVSQWLFGVVNIFGELLGNIILPQDSSSADTHLTDTQSVSSQNEFTGPFSQNESTISISADKQSETNNTAEILNQTELLANSGNNHSFANTGEGKIQTSETYVSLSETTFANTDILNEEGTVWLVIVNEMGKWVGKILGAPWGTLKASNFSSGTTSLVSKNSSTGPFSSNESILSSTNSASLIDKNQAQIENKIEILADSGNNQTSYNTGDGLIETGEAYAGASLINFANTTVKAKKFVTVMVNILGTFLGNIIPPNSQKELVSSEEDSSSAFIGGDFNDSFFSVEGDSLEKEKQENSFSNDSFSSTSFSSLFLSAEKDNQETGESFSENNFFPPKTLISHYEGPKEWSKKEKLEKKIILASNRDQVSFPRGLFLSPAFAAATETSLAAVLFQGVQFKPENNWMSIFPFLLFLFFFRRRKILVSKIIKHLNALLEVIL